MTSIIPPKLSEVQEKGNACAHCGREYVLSDGAWVVPLQRDGVFITGPAGWQLYVCVGSCEQDVSVADILDAEQLDEDEKSSAHQADGNRGNSLGEAYHVGYADGLARGRRYPVPDRPGTPDVSDEVLALRAMYGPPTIDEVARVAAWSNLGVAELLELRDGHPLDRNEIRQVVMWADDMSANMTAIMRHFGISRPGGGSQ